MECPRRLDHPRRSGATLNPGGVRIGTAEIHNQVEQMPELAEGLCIGQTFDDDVRVVLVVRLASNVLTETLETRIGAKIRGGCSPRHVPSKIVAVADIPRTRSGKIAELAVLDVVHGRPVSNKDALANPESLDVFRNLRARNMVDRLRRSAAGRTDFQRRAAPRWSFARIRKANEVRDG